MFYEPPMIRRVRNVSFTLLIVLLILNICEIVIVFITISNVRDIIRENTPILNRLKVILNYVCSNFIDCTS